MLRLIVCLFSYLLITNPVTGQLKLYSGIEFSMCKDKMVTLQTAYDVEVSPFRSPSFGAFVGNRFNPNLKAELGFTHKTYNYLLTYTGNGYNKDFFQLLDDEIYQVYFRIVPRIGLLDQKLFLFSTLGIYGYYQNSAAHGTSVGSMNLGVSDTLFYQYNYANDIGGKAIFEAGLGLEYEFEKGITLSTAGKYFFGFNTITRWDYSHQFNATGPTINATFLNKGNYYCLSVAVAYRFNRK